MNVANAYSQKVKNDVLLPYTVSPRVKNNSKPNLILKAKIRDRNGRMQMFKPEVDNGCTITCIHPKIVKRFGLRTSRLPYAIPVVNADGTDTKQGDASVLAKVCLMIDNHIELLEALILDIGDNEMLLGLDWLATHNPKIDWQKRTLEFVRCPRDCHSACIKISHYLKKVIEKDEDKLAVDANGINRGKIPQHVKEKYGYLFEPWNFDKLPKRREWDHAINLVPDAPNSIPARNYRLTRDEFKALDDFLNEEQKAGKI